MTKVLRVKKDVRGGQPIKPPRAPGYDGPPERAFTKEIIADALMACSGNVTWVAKRLATSRSVVDSYIARYPELHEVRLLARMELVEVAEEVVQTNIRGALKKKASEGDKNRGLNSAKWLLERDELTRKKFSRHQEHTGPDGGPIQHAVVTVHLTPETIKALPSHVRAKLLAGDPETIRAVRDMRAESGDHSGIAGRGSSGAGDDASGEPESTVGAVHSVGESG